MSAIQSTNSTTNEAAWDGLADEQGPIPAFGPATLDEQGRLVMSDEEWAARSDALRRTLLILPTLTDETDSDEVWANFDPTLGRGD